VAVIERDCSGSEPRPRALDSDGTAEALGLLTKLIEETFPIGLDEVRTDAVTPDADADHSGILAHLIRPSSQFVISRI
jgi:hypothetical protein